MNASLWTLQLAFGALFLVHGLMLIRQPARMRRALSRLPFSAGLLRFIGACELLGGLGLVLPYGLDIAPCLTPVAAAGLARLVAGASSYHLSAREPGPGVATGLFSVLLVTVALGRSAGF